MKYVLLISILFVLTACAKPAEIEQVPIVEVRTLEIQRPEPIVPNVDQLSLRPITWIILTPDNIEEKFAQIQSGELVLFAVTTAGYENIALNLSDIRALIAQQNRIIAIYKSQYE